MRRGVRNYILYTFYNVDFLILSENEVRDVYFFSFAGLLANKYFVSRFYKKIVAYFLGKISECVNSGKPPEVLISEIIEESF